MRETVAVTPELLRWARESAGMSAREAADALKYKTVSARIIEQWESGKGGPTYSQLEKIAEAYRRPVAAFFLPREPSEPGLKEQFRSLPDAYLAKIPARIRFMVRRCAARQADLRELYEGANPSARKIFADVKIDERGSAREWAEKARQYIGVSLEAQFGWKDEEDALKNWRDSLEECGVWIFKDSFQEDDYSGFCLPDGQFPVIFLNNNMPKTRQTFTLFHELAHILRGRGGVDFRNSRIPADSRYRREEAFCNAFAGELLVPDESLFAGGKPQLRDDADIEKLAKKYGVSREVVLRRFLDRGFVNRAEYDEKTERWNKKSFAAGKTGGGDYYATRFAYLGRKFISAAFDKYRRQAISERELADYLGIKARNIGGFEDYLLRGAQ